MKSVNIVRCYQTMENNFEKPKSFVDCTITFFKCRSSKSLAAPWLAVHERRMPKSLNEKIPI